MDKKHTWLVVGLGLLGGRYAQILSAKGYTVTGITRSPDTLRYALDHGYITAGKTSDFTDLLRQADRVVFGLYPTALLDWVGEYGRFFRPGWRFRNDQY